MRCLSWHASVPTARCSTWQRARAVRRSRPPAAPGTGAACSRPTSRRRSSHSHSALPRPPASPTSPHRRWMASGSEVDPASVDAVISRLGLIYFPDQAAALAGMHRALRPGGRFAAVVYSTSEANRFFSVPRFDHPPTRGPTGRRRAIPARSASARPRRSRPRSRMRDSPRSRFASLLESLIAIRSNDRSATTRAAPCNRRVSAFSEGAKLTSAPSPR